MEYKEYLSCKKPYQEVGHTFLLERKHACLFYKPGKGKTYPAVDAMRDVDKSMGGKARVLILSTADAINNMWLSEIEPQGILPLNTVLMSFTKAIQDVTKATLLKVKWDVIVIDECHKIKSHNAKISKLVHLLSKKTEYVWGLTGTPRGNNDVDIYCQFHNMCIRDWGDINYTNFVNICCDVDKKFFHGNQILIPIGINHKYLAGWERNIAMYSQRIGYDEEDDMPELNEEIIRLHFIPTKEYLAAEDGVIRIPDYETTMTKLAAIQKLHQLANGFLYIKGEDKRDVYIVNLENEKLNWIKNNLSDKQVIVYRFEHDCNEIVKELDKLGVSHTEIVDDFKNGDYNVLLLQCSRCESFNLQMCNKIIFYTLDYSFIKYDQMIHRVWRMGQKNDVKIYILLMEHSVEESIWRAVKNKKELAELFMDIKGEM